jgi:hypothetical protein
MIIVADVFTTWRGRTTHPYAIRNWVRS